MCLENACVEKNSTRHTHFITLLHRMYRKILLIQLLLVIYDESKDIMKDFIIIIIVIVIYYQTWFQT